MSDNDLSRMATELKKALEGTLVPPTTEEKAAVVEFFGLVGGDVTEHEAGAVYEKLFELMGSVMGRCIGGKMPSERLLNQWRGVGASKTLEG